MSMVADMRRWVLAQIDERLLRSGITSRGVDAAYVRGNIASGSVTIGGAPLGTAGHAIADEGTALTQRATLNFTGPGVRAADNSGAARTDVTVNRWEPLTNGNAGTPELIFLAGDVIMMERP